MITKETPYFEYDTKNIGTIQQIALQFVFDTVDLNKIAFCGGIADYLNLREYYDMPVNDLDLVYENEEDLKLLIIELNYKRYVSKFYSTKTGETLVFKYKFGDRNLNMDTFPTDFSTIELQESWLLGKKVLHFSFNQMKKVHNEEIPLKTSEARGNSYEWKRLYKHSKKASLYNNIIFLQEKNLIGTIKRAFVK